MQHDSHPDPLPVPPEVTSAIDRFSGSRSGKRTNGPTEPDPGNHHADPERPRDSTAEELLVPALIQSLLKRKPVSPDLRELLDVLEGTRYLVEPPTEHGVHSALKEYIRRLRDYCKKYQIALTAQLAYAAFLQPIKNMQVHRPDRTEDPTQELWDLISWHDWELMVFGHLSRPLDIARLFWEHAPAKLVRFAGRWFEFTGTVYRLVNDAVIRKRMYDFQTCVWYSADKNMVRSVPTKSTVDYALDALMSLALVDGERMPVWLDHRVDPPVDQVIALTNGLLVLNDLNKPLPLLPHTEHLLTTSMLTFAYDPSADCPHFRKFLTEVFEDPETIRCVQKALGYLLSNDRSYQKIIAFVGPMRSGKGTVAKVLETLFGNSLISMSIAKLGGRFALWDMIGKQVLLIPDAHVKGNDDKVPLVELLKSISGEDQLTVERKFKDPVSIRLNSAIVIMANEMPNFGDTSGALASRFVLFRTKKSFLGREDMKLIDKLRKEMPGIFNFALEGLSMLRRDGHLSSPKDSMDHLDAISQADRPIAAFIEERCEVGPTFQVAIHQMYEDYKVWADKNGYRPLTHGEFGKAIYECLPNLKRKRPANGNRHRIYVGVKLRHEFPWHG